MKRIVTLMVIAGMVVSGCGSEQKNEKTSQTGNTQTYEKPAPAAVEETKPPVSDELRQKIDEVDKSSGDPAGLIQEKTAPVIEKTREAATDLVETVQDKTEAAVRETAEAAKALEEAVAEKTAPAAVSVTETATEITRKETEAVQDTGLQNAKMESPDVVVLENNKGEITMPHKEHGESFACETCHAENGPGPLSLGKEAGHKLCKGCHSEMQAGPTKCSECHKKTE